MTTRAKKTPSKRKSSSRSTGGNFAGTRRTALHENPWFSVRKRGKYYTIENRQEQVIILPIVENQGVVLVRVKRPVINDNPLELPAGGIEAGETPEAGAARELFEETGIMISELSRFVPMVPLSPSPNRIPTRLHVFRVDITHDEFAKRGPYDNEITGIEYVSLDELVSRIVRGEIYVLAPLAILATFLLSGTIDQRDRSRQARISTELSPRAREN